MFRFFLKQTNNWEIFEIWLSEKNKFHLILDMEITLVKVIPVIIRYRLMKATRIEGSVNNREKNEK